MKKIILAAAMLLAGCSMSPQNVNLYGGGNVIPAQLVWDRFADGTISFRHADGEQFSGQCTSVSPEAYSMGLAGLIGSGGWGGVVPSVRTYSSNVGFGIATFTGDRGTQGACKYITSFKMLQYKIIGECQDSLGRKYLIQSGTEVSN